MVQDDQSGLVAACIELLAGSRKATDGVGQVCRILSGALSADFVTAVIVQKFGAGIYILGHSKSPDMLPVVGDPGLADGCRAFLSEGSGPVVVDGEHPLGSCLSDVASVEGSQLVQPFVTERADQYLLALVVGWPAQDEQRDRELDDSLKDVLQTVSRLVEMAIRDTHWVNRLREQTRKVRRTRSSANLPSMTVLSRYKDLFETVSDAILLVDRGLTVAYVNHTGQGLTGYSSDWLCGRKLTDIVSTQQRDQVKTVFGDVINGRQMTSFDVDVVTTSGDLICVSMTVRLLPGGDNLLAVSCQDMTDTRVVEQELVRTKEFLERLIRSVVDAVLYCDPDGTVKLFNPGAENLFGYASEDVVGTSSITELFPKGEADKLLAQIRSPRKGGVGRLDPVESVVLVRDGDRKDVRLTGSVVFDEGEEAGVVFIISDMTDTVRLKERYYRIQEKLLVREKQALLTQLAGTTAHELNQPLTSILGYCELLKRQLSDDATGHRAVDVIMSEAQRMADIVRKIGQITQYKTKAYVGSTEILDLDKSSE